MYGKKQKFTNSIVSNWKKRSFQLFIEIKNYKLYDLKLKKEIYSYLFHEEKKKLQTLSSQIGRRSSFFHI